MTDLKKQLILDLHDVGALKFGSFKLKSGATSPFYIDLRGIISYPRIMRNLVALITELVKDLEFDVITGIPYTALPLASLLSDALDVPLVYQRKEAKAYGTSKLIEGVFEAGQTCLVIDDLITTGESKFESAEALEAAGLKVQDFIIVVDRSPNGTEILAERGYRLESIITIEDMLATLGEAGLLETGLQEQVRAFVSAPAVASPQTFEERLDSVETPMVRRVMERILEKETNLILSLDTSDSAEFFEILEAAGSEILMVKTHVDIMDDYNGSVIPRLKALAERHGFFIFEDRKFADIGSTVRKQFQGGVYTMADWAEYVTVHMIAGEAILDGLFGDTPREVGAFLLARMSAAGNLISETFTRQVLDIGKQRTDCVAGYIGYGRSEAEIRRLRQKIDPRQLLLMPGVNLDVKGDNLGQQYMTADVAMAGGVDAIIVGRGIYGSDNPGAQAARYREIAWQAFKANQ